MQIKLLKNEENSKMTNDYLNNKSKKINKKQRIIGTIKSQNGFSLTTFILLFLILSIIVFLIYEFFYADIFGIILKQGETNLNLENFINTIEYIPKYQNQTNVNQQELISQNIEIYKPTANPNYRK